MLNFPGNAGREVELSRRRARASCSLFLISQRKNGKKSFRRAEADRELDARVFCSREVECSERRGCQLVNVTMEWLRTKLSFEVLRARAKVSPVLCERVKEDLV